MSFHTISAVWPLAVLGMAVFLVFVNKEVPSLSASASYQSQEEDNREVSNLGAGDGSASKPTEPVSEQAGDDPGSESANYHSGSGSEDLGEANDDDDKEKEHKPGLLLMMGFIIAGFLFCLVIVGVIYCMAKCGRSCRSKVNEHFSSVFTNITASNQE